MIGPTKKKAPTEENQATACMIWRSLLGQYAFDAFGNTTAFARAAVDKKSHDQKTSQELKKDLIAGNMI